MGMFDDPNYSPADPNDQTQQYKSPSADPFAEFGITTPLQKDQMAYQRQVQMQQQQMQMALQQQQLVHAQQQQSVDAASLASGYAFPTYLAMQAGKGVDNPMLTKGLSALGGMAAQGLGAAPRPGTQAPPMPPGMMGGQQPGLGGEPSSGMMARNTPQDDPASILSAAMVSHGGDTASALQEAGTKILQAAQSDTDPNRAAQLMRTGTAMLTKANALAQAKTNTDVTNAVKGSEIVKNTSQAAKDQTEITKPNDMGTINYPGGDTGKAYSEFNPATGKYELKSGFRGQALSRVETSTVAQKGEEVKSFRDLGDAVIGTAQKIDQVKGLLKQGAAAGTWAQDGVSIINNALGTLGQILPKSQYSDEAKATLDEIHKSGTFAHLAGISAENESILNDLTMNLASTYNQSEGGRVSTTAINRAAKTIGESIGNPDTFAQVLDSVKSRTLDNYETKYGSYKASVTTPEEIATMDRLHKYTRSKIDPQQTEGDDPRIPADAPPTVKAIMRQHFKDHPNG